MPTGLVGWEEYSQIIIPNDKEVPRDSWRRFYKEMGTFYDGMPFNRISAGKQLI